MDDEAFTTQYQPGATKVFGRSVQRLEDPPLVTGRGRYIGDMGFAHMLHMRIVRAPFAHATLRAVDASAALALPGVVAVWTAADLGDLGPIDFRDPAGEAIKPYRQPILATGTVRYVGEPVAAVFATDPYVAEDAADLVVLDAEELPPVMDVDAAPASFAPGLSTESLVLRTAYGDVEGAFARAHGVVSLRLSIGRHSGVPLETRGAIGRYDAAFDVLQLWGAAKVPHRNRDSLSRAFGRSLAGIELHEGHTGGGFGIRGELYPEDYLVLAAAMRLGRPVKWIEDRREHLMTANQSREQTHHVRAAYDADGVLLAIDDEFFHDQGAYFRTHGARVADFTIGTLPGPYRLPAYRSLCHVRMTNKTPAATYRSPGRFESSFVRERVADAVARALALDPAEVRRRNLITVDQMPFNRNLTASGHDLEHDSGDYTALLEQAMARFGWQERREACAKARAAGELVGVGMGYFVEKGGLGPRDSARVVIDPTGAVELITGGASIGQGFETSMAQICAEALGVDYRRVRVVHGQTNRIDFGIGAHASRATVMTGGAVNAASLKLRAKVLRVAGQMLQADPASLDIVDGMVLRPGAGAGAGAGDGLAVGDIARFLSFDAEHLGGETPGLSAEDWFETHYLTFPFGVHLAQTRIDPATGQVRIEAYLIAYDIGRCVNPALVHGQLVGGFAQGLGGALFEEFRYDARGEPLSVTLADYLLPTLHEVPAVDVLLTEAAPSQRNPLGIKSAGEGGITPVGAAIAAAVDDALGNQGQIVTLPITPQYLRRCLRQAAG